MRDLTHLRLDLAHHPPEIFEFITAPGSAAPSSASCLLRSRRPLRLGYQLAIYPATGFLAMGQALTKVYRSLSDHGALGS